MQAAQQLTTALVITVKIVFLQPLHLLVAVVAVSLHKPDLMVLVGMVDLVVVVHTMTRALARLLEAQRLRAKVLPVLPHLQAAKQLVAAVVLQKHPQ